MLKSIGMLLFLAGALSTIFYFVEYNARIFSWITNWGPNIAWVIRIGGIVLGAILYFIGKRDR